MRCLRTGCGGINRHSWRRADFVAWFLMVMSFIGVIGVGAGGVGAEDVGHDPLAWRGDVGRSGPWARWWWLGSAVEKGEITREFEAFKAAGIGGVEICPIYGAKGYEERYIPFLSDKWVEMLKHTVEEGKRLGVGVDMTTGTGWPFGGTGVSEQDASSKLVLKRYEVTGGEQCRKSCPTGGSLHFRGSRIPARSWT